MVYNEFKSVIAQRLVVERILPIVEIGKQDIAHAEEIVERGAGARRRSGPNRRRDDHGLAEEPRRRKEAEEEAKKFGTAEVDYIYEQPPAEMFAACCPDMSPRSSIMRCWSRSRPSRRRA